MKRISWRYLAGLVDGEGCLDFQMGKLRSKPDITYIRPRLRLAMTDSSRFVLELIKANHGGNIWQSKRNRLNSNWNDAFFWQLQGRGLRPFLQNIVNHLYIKKEQAKFLIWWIDNMVGKESNNQNSGKDGNELRQFARKELSAMKADPQRLSEVAVKNFGSFGYGIWSPYSNQCLQCGTTDKLHEAKGYCKQCYDKIRNSH